MSKYTGGEEKEMAIPKEKEQIRPSTPVDVRRKRLIRKITREICARNDEAMRRLAKS
ncbi:hypothetical protein [Kyrpidia spormannii]|uniref:hypothetical protein n=1 Tax=Kyrpidia spormannii TaxID=2055160 RepID=UPI0012FFDC51|nr:hypothetical protein [Kyrpidia spormannii]